MIGLIVLLFHLPIGHYWGKNSVKGVRCSDT